MSKLGYLPECWIDDVRMSSLFSGFRNKDVNPTDWESKMKFWSDLIIESCKQTKHLVFDYSLLSERFRRKGVVPLGLTVVIEELYRLGKIKPLAEIQNDLKIESWTNWGIKVFIQKPFSWAFQSILNFEKCNIQKSKFVVIQNLEEMVMDVKNTLNKKGSDSQKDYLIEFEEFKELFKDINQESLNLILLQLQKEKILTMKDLSADCKVLKFSRNDDAKVPIISDVDVGIINLKRAEVIIQRKIDTVNEKINKSLEEAKYYLKENSKLAAKNSLRIKCKYQRLVDKYENSKFTILQLLQSIENAESDKMALDSHDDIQEAMMLPQESIAELEEELDELLSESPDVDNSPLPAEMVKRPDAVFPDVPVFEPGSSPISQQKSASGLPDVPEFDPTRPSTVSRSAIYSPMTQ